MGWQARIQIPWLFQNAKLSSQDQTTSPAIPNGSNPQAPIRAGGGYVEPIIGRDIDMDKTLNGMQLAIGI
jgi:hypothetical protein